MPQFSPAQIIQELGAGQVRPVYLVTGEERYFRQRVIEAVRRAVLGNLDASLNEDQFVAGEVDARTVVGAARTLPMFGPRRLVVVRVLYVWQSAARLSGQS